MAFGSNEKVWILSGRYDNGEPHIISIHRSEETAIAAKYMLEDINRRIPYDGAKYTITKHDLLK